jgi:hypothetical protein
VAFVSAIFAWLGVVAFASAMFAYTFAWLCAVLFVVLFGDPGPETEWWVDQFSNALGYMSLILVFVLGVDFGARHISETVGQKSYDIKSELLYNEVIEGIHEVFLVFLRPFYTTNKILVNDDLDLWLSEWKLKTLYGWRHIPLGDPASEGVPIDRTCSWAGKTG